MHRGYVKIWRRLKDSDMWLKEKFTRGQAWVDLIMLANHRGGFIRKRGVRVNLKRGDIGWSERELANRWKWSRDKVRRFLNELCSESESKLIPQNTPQNKNVTSCYSLVNYRTYQDGQTAETTTNKTTNRPQTDRKQDQNKNVKNVKNVNKRKKNIKKKEYSDEFLKFYNFYPKHTDKAEAFDVWQKLNGDRPKTDDLITAIENQIKFKSHLKSQNQFCPEWKNPARWLRRHCWEDECEIIDPWENV